jgi:hypothetical protein
MSIADKPIQFLPRSRPTDWLSTDGSMTGALEGKRATGGDARGVGEGIVGALAREGARAVVADAPVIDGGQILQAARL